LPEEGNALFCGGKIAEGDAFGTDKCFKWNPIDGWFQTTSMNYGRQMHILVEGPNILEGTDKLQPIAIGE